MKSYWLTLEAYVFVWCDANEVLIYNTYSGKGIVYKSTPSINRIMSNLLKKENLYCTSISESDLSDQEIFELIESIRNSFCGDLIDKSLFPQKPIVFIPKANINDDLSREKDLSYNPHIFGGNILKNLTDITIQLTGKCLSKCANCGKTNKQTNFCYKNTETMSIEKVKYILNQIKYSTVFEINFIGGDIFQYPYWKAFIGIIKENNCKKNFYINYASFLNSKYNNKIEDITSNNNSYLKVMVELSEINCNEFIYKDDRRLNPEYLFIIKNEEELKKSIKYLETGINGKIIPFFTGKNIDFFQNYIFLEKEDILSTVWKKNEIFSNQYVNTNDFGKLIFSSDGEIFANINFPSAGKWNDDLKEVVYNELKEGSVWRRVRAQVVPCKRCIYCHICPPLSNYELIIGRPNLCHI